MTQWSLDAAARAFFLRHPDEPRNVYRKDPERLRETAPDIAEQILALEPRHSNDYYLEPTVTYIVDLLPPPIDADADSIFVARTATLEPNAEATALAEDARVAYMYQGLGTALLFYAYLQRRIVRLLFTLDRSAATTMGDVVRLAEAHLPQLAADSDVALVLQRRKRWAQAEQVDIDPQVIGVLERWDDVLPSGTPAVNELQDVGEHFVVAHEIAHHLLGHLHRKPFAYRAHPAATALLQARQRLGVQIDEDRWNSDQLAEFDADAFAFLTLAGEIQAPGSFDWHGWYGALIGSLLALPALEDLATAAASAVGEANPPRMVADTHPPVGDRIAQLVEFTEQYPPPGEEASELGHPMGIISQVLLYWKFLNNTRYDPPR